MGQLEFSKQKLGYCAHYSLMHALQLLGIRITGDDAIKFLGIPRWKIPITGTDEKKLIRGIERAGCIAHPFTCHSESQARNEIDKLLDADMPVIINCEDEQHWAVIAGRKGNQYYWIDSYDKDLVGHWNWSEIAEWMCYDDTEYYFIGIESKDMLKSLVRQFPALYPRLKNTRRSILGRIITKLF